MSVVQHIACPERVGGNPYVQAGRTQPDAPIFVDMEGSEVCTCQGTARYLPCLPSGVSSKFSHGHTLQLRTSERGGHAAPTQVEAWRACTDRS